MQLSGSKIKSIYPVEKMAGHPCWIKRIYDNIAKAVRGRLGSKDQSHYQRAKKARVGGDESGAIKRQSGFVNVDLGKCLLSSSMNISLNEGQVCETQQPKHEYCYVYWKVMNGLFHFA